MGLRLLTKYVCKAIDLRGLLCRKEVGVSLGHDAERYHPANELRRIPHLRITTIVVLTTQSSELTRKPRPACHQPL
jgi:hypothetical protein